MLIFNCTKAASEFFTSTRKGEKLSPVMQPKYRTIEEEISLCDAKERNWHWLVHVFRFQRKNVLMIMDYSTRFVICLTGLQKGNYSDFVGMFDEHLIHHAKHQISKMNLPENLIDCSVKNYAAQHDAAHFYQRGDRSTQNHINDAIWMFEHSAYNFSMRVVEKSELIDIDNYLNHTPRTKKGKKNYFWPKYDFIYKWLVSYLGLAEEKESRLSNYLRKIEGYAYDNTLPDLSIEDFSIVSGKSSIKQPGVRLLPSNVICISDYVKKKKSPPS